jgi:hypothetical protein
VTVVKFEFITILKMSDTDCLIVFAFVEILILFLKTLNAFILKIRN